MERTNFYYIDEPLPLNRTSRCVNGNDQSLKTTVYRQSKTDSPFFRIDSFSKEHIIKSAQTRITPVIKWVGGKSQLLDTILPMVPENFGKYYEPFAGGAALFFALKPKKAVLNDFNPQLINLYKQIRNKPEKLKNKLMRLEKSHDGTKEFYEQRRAEFNGCLSRHSNSIKSAALMVYLNKAGFNGLYRLNKRGEFNVAFGKRKKVRLFEEENFDCVSNLLKNTELMTGDFEAACKGCKKGDFVFFDSPYFNTFDTYQKDGFSEADHRRLKTLFDELTRKGVYCMLTNSNEQFIKDLYSDYHIKVVGVKRNINRDSSKRTGQEVIITNYNPANSEIISVYSINDMKGALKMEKINQEELLDELYRYAMIDLSYKLMYWNNNIYHNTYSAWIVYDSNTGERIAKRKLEYGKEDSHTIADYLKGHGYGDVVFSSGSEKYFKTQKEINEILEI